ncbi:hypothetical protein ACWEO2_41715 [Nocardia sp. NPDC004278]
MAIGNPSKIGETDDIFAWVVRAHPRLERPVIDTESVSRREDDLFLAETGPGNILTVAGFDDELDISARHRGLFVRGREPGITDDRIGPIGVVVLEKPLKFDRVVDV